MEGRWRDTYQKYHPGVTVMWLSGFSIQGIEAVAKLAGKDTFRSNQLYFPYIHLAAKLPLVFVTSVLGTVCFWCLKKLTKDKTFPWIFVLLLSLEPFFLGISRFLHVTTLTVMFSFVSFLLMLVWLEGFTGKAKPTHRYFILSSICLGLAALTRVDGVLAGIANSVVILVWLLKHQSSWSLKKVLVTFRDWLFFSAAHAAIGFLTFCALFPAIWVNARDVLRNIKNDGLGDTAFAGGGALMLVPYRPLYYLEAFFFRSLPTTVFLTAAGFLIFLREAPRKLRDKKYPFVEGVVWYSLIFLAVIWAFFAFPKKTKDRYLTSLQPGLIILAAYALYKILDLLKRRGRLILVSVLVLLYGLTFYRYHPNYSFYYTDLIGGAGGLARFGLSVIHRGEFEAQAAWFLNDQPESYNRNVVVLDREQVPSFKVFFLGDTFSHSKFMPEGAHADYLVARPDHLKQIPRSQCELIKTVGVRAPNPYDQLFIYECEGVDKETKFYN